MSFCKMCQAVYRIAAIQFSSYNQARLVTTSVVCKGKKMQKTVTTAKSRTFKRFNVENKNAKLTNLQPTDYNPGIGRRLKILKEDTPDVETRFALTDEDLEELEGDFLNAREMNKYHESAATKLRFRDELKMTEQKHFKRASEPNMLTWSEKNQIKLLHGEDSVKWSLEKLADSFPATPQIIKKVIKSSWKPDSNSRIKAHDQQVCKNWEAFNEGKLQITDPLLREHLKKFTKRILLPPDAGDKKNSVDELPKPQNSEFVDIIHSYNSLQINDKVKKKSIEGNSITKSVSCDRQISNDYHESSTSIVPRQFDEKHSENVSTPLRVKNSLYTLDTLREEMKKQQDDVDVNYVNAQDRELMKGKSSMTTVVSWSDELIAPASYNNTNNENTHLDTNIKKYNEKSAMVPQNVSDDGRKRIKKRIHIPKNKVKAGYLYKVQDCFYSHDGFFLYRVPGKISDNC